MTTPQSGPNAVGSDDARSSGPDELPRRLGVLYLAVLIIAFSCPIATMAGFQQLAVGFGNGAGAPVAFFVGGAVLLIFSVGFISMSRYIKYPGAFYCYIVEGLGRSVGLGGAFLATSAYVLLVAGSYVYMGVIAADVAGQLAGQPILTWPVWTLIFLAVITALGLLRADLSLTLIGILALVEVAVVAIWQVAIFVQGGPEGYSASSFAPPVFLSGNVGLAILFAMLTMIGIEAGACFRHEARDPDKSVKRATWGATGFMTVFYALGCWAYIISQGASDVVAQSRNDPVGSFLGSIDQYIGAFFVQVVIIVLVTSQMAAINAIQGAASRYLYALGRDGTLPSVFGRVHPRLQSPYVAVLAVNFVSLVFVVVIWMSGIDAVPAYAGLTGVSIFFLLPLFIGTSVAVIAFYRKRPEFNAGPWASLIAPALSVVALSVLFVLTALTMDILAGSQVVGLIALAGLVVIALGGFFLARRYKKTRPEVYERIGTTGHG